MANTEFLFFVNESNNSLYLMDKTVYPVQINSTMYSRSDIALAMVYSYNNFVTKHVVLGNSLGNLIASNTDIGKFRIYVIPLFAAGPYAKQQVVCKDDVFYVSVIDNNYTTPTATNDKWITLTTGNAETHLENSMAAKNPFMRVDLICDIPELEPFVLKKLENNTYEIMNSFPDVNSINAIALYDYEGAAIEMLSGGIIVPDDGVYKLVISYNMNVGEETGDGGSDGDTSTRTFVSSQYATLIITHVDSIECCYKKMIQSLYCKGSDYCVDGDCFAQREVTFRINELSNLYFMLFHNMAVSRMKFYYLLDDSAEKIKYVQEVGRILKIAKIIRDNCKESMCHG